MVIDRMRNLELFPSTDYKIHALSERTRAHAFQGDHTKFCFSSSYAFQLVGLQTFRWRGGGK